MRPFYVLKIVQAVCCFMVLCFALSVTELRGRLFFKSDDGVNLTYVIMNAPGGACCESFIIYKPMQKKPDRARAPDGVSSLASGDDNEGGSGDGGSSGRILAIIDGLKTSKDANFTNELKLRGFVLFEWENNKHAPLPTMGNDTTATANNLPEETIHATADAEEEEEEEDASKRPQFPNGTQIYKLTKLEGVRSAAVNDHPFRYVSSRLFAFTLVSFLQLVAIAIHAIFWDNNVRCPLFELLFPAFCLFIWLVMLCLAAAVSIKWDSLWHCTNFRPEKPAAFLITAVFASILIVLYLCEALCAEELLTTYQKKKERKGANATVLGTGATTILKRESGNRQALKEKPTPAATGPNAKDNKEGSQVKDEFYMIHVKV